MALPDIRIGLPVTLHPSPGSLGVVLARQILAGIRLAALEGRRYLLGCPGGRSARPVYGALGRLAAEAGADLAGAVIVMMDEYMVEGPGGPVLCPPDAHYSCRRFAEAEIRGVLNAALPEKRRVPADGIWLPDPQDPPAYDARIAAAGGIDLFLLASGGSDGHVAFNPPGTAAESPSAIVRLAETTRRDNLGTFPDFRSLEEVPPWGLTIGLGTIAAQSRAVAMLIHGAHKQAAARRLLASTGFVAGWPATIVHRCRDAAIHLDRAAAGLASLIPQGSGVLEGAADSGQEDVANYSSVDRQISDWAHRHSLVVCSFWAGQENRLAYLSSTSGDCFRIWIDAPNQGRISIHADCVEGPREDDAPQTWEVALSDLDTTLDSVIEVVLGWMLPAPRFFPSK